MPPADSKQLTTSEIALIRRWIQAGAHLSEQTPATSSETPTHHDVTPILFRRCTVCHGGTYLHGQLDLRTKAQMLAGGASGPAIVAYSPAESRLVQRAGDRQCPPKKDVGEAGIEPMTPAELATVERWIAAGAPLADELPDLE